MASLIARTSVATGNLTLRTSFNFLKLASAGQRRNLNVQEHISYSLLNSVDIPTPKFGVATSGKEAEDIAAKLGTKFLAVKAQVLAGGRGVGRFKNGFKGGVRLVNSPKEAGEVANKMIGQVLVTKQTGEEGKPCNKVMIAERAFQSREFYFAIMMERSYNGPIVIASSQGGVSIEDVAAETPEAIHYQPIDITVGLTPEDACAVAKKVGLEKHADETSQMLLNMYDLFVEKDALLIEINPYAEDAIAGGFRALDAKLLFDDNAKFRQEELFNCRDDSQEDARELLAAKFDLNYITLDGSIGCMVNGAGLAMATMDIIQLNGGSPANFLDVGGGGTKETVTEAFKIITSDPKVHAILVNIFGGIMRCDTIAEGIIAAAKDLDLQIPVVVRLKGVNENPAKELISKSGLKLLARDGLSDAAKLVVTLANISVMAAKENIKVGFEVMDKGSGGGGGGGSKSGKSICGGKKK